MRRKHLSSMAKAGFLVCLAAPIVARPLEIVIPPKGGLRVGNHGSRHLIPLEGFGANPNEMYRPLKVCQGDCDVDEDCKGDLVCFQREPGDPVPGCEGGEEAMSKTDFCIENPQESNKQEGQKSLSSNQSETKKKSYKKSQEGTSSAEYKLAIEGDSSHPSKSVDEPVVKDSASEDKGSSTPQEKEVVVENAAVQTKSSQGGGLSILVGYGSSPDQMLKECEGDCDSDDDCQGSLVCFQRESGQAVPGCDGIAMSKSDFCVKSTKSSNFAGASDRKDTTSNSENSQYVFTTGDEFSSAAVSDESESEQESDPLKNKLIVAAIISAAVLLAVCLTCVTCRFLRSRDRKCWLDK